MARSVLEHIRKLRLSINYHIIVLHIFLLKQRMKVAGSKLLAKTLTMARKVYAASLVSISLLKQWLGRMNVSQKRLLIGYTQTVWAMAMKRLGMAGSSVDVALSNLLAKQITKLSQTTSDDPK